MNRAIVMAWHKYTPFGKQYYQPIFDYFLKNLRLWADEFDKLYLLDSTWNFTVQDAENLQKIKDNSEIIKVNSSLRYYDAYKEFLPQVKEDLVLFLDNDMVIYKEGVIKNIFAHLDIQDLSVDFDKHEEQHADVVSIYDTIGKTFKELGGKSKFCPYLFATRKELLMQYKDVDWGSNMPEYETLGKLTEAMLKDGIKPYEMEEDKSNILINGHQDGLKGKDLGYYHIRASSIPAVLLAWLHEGITTSLLYMKTYFDYLKNQPKTEYVRQIAWFWYMCFQTKNEKVMRNLSEVLRDAHIKEDEWYRYFRDFVNYHNLPYETYNRKFN